MKTNPLISICRRLPLPALAAVAALALGGCDVTQPDENPWREASAYSWPASVGKVLHYRKDDLVENTTKEIRIRISIADTTTSDGNTFFELREIGSPTRRLFLPLKDKLLTPNSEFPDDLALLTPLEKGHSWICGTSAQGMPWKATILERYSFRKVEGIIYRNVIEVEYKPEFPVTNDDMTIVTRFYAEGQGLIQTLESVVSRPASPDDSPSLPKEVERTVLVKTEDAPNS